MPQPNAAPIDPVKQQLQLLEIQLQALGSVCNCRLNASCWQLMQQLAYIGALPSDVLSMTDEEWLAGCGLPASLVEPPVLPPSPPGR